MSSKAIYNLDAARVHFFKHLKIKLTAKDDSKLSTLQTLLKEKPGEMTVILEYHHQTCKVDVRCGDKYTITPHDDLILKLNELLTREPELIS